MASPAIIANKNTGCQSQPGHVDWTHGTPDGVATADEHTHALRVLGGGWHSIHTVCREIGARALFRLLAADFIRYAGDDAAGDPVYLLLF